MAVNRATAFVCNWRHSKRSKKPRHTRLPVSDGAFVLKLLYHIVLFLYLTVLSITCLVSLYMDDGVGPRHIHKPHQLHNVSKLPKIVAFKKKNNRLIYDMIINNI